MYDFLFFKIISFILSAGIVWYSLRVLSTTKLKVLFALSIFFFFASTVLFFEEGLIGEWGKHLPFFIGQILLYFFFLELIKKPQNIKPLEKKPSGLNVAHGVVGMSVASEDVNNFLLFATEQGVQHFLVLPVLVVIIATTRTQMILREMNDFVPFRFLFSGLIALAMIHVVEFFVESQGFFPFLEGTGIEVLEFFLYYLALFCLGVGLQKYYNVNMVIKNI